MTYCSSCFESDKYVQTYHDSGKEEQNDDPEPAVTSSRCDLDAGVLVEMPNKRNQRQNKRYYPKEDNESKTSIHVRDLSVLDREIKGHKAIHGQRH